MNFMRRAANAVIRTGGTYHGRSLGLRKDGTAFHVETRGSAFTYLCARAEGNNLSVSAFQASFSYDEAAQVFDRLVVTFDAEGKVREVAITRAEDERRAREAREAAAEKD